MDKKSQYCWSKELQLQTREAIQELPIFPDGNLHFKHATLGFAKASLLDILYGTLVLHCNDKFIDYHYSDAEALIKAGWVID